MLHGVLIKESITDEAILDCLTVVRTELWKTQDVPKYWTAIYFETADMAFPKKLSAVLAKGWYCDLKYKDALKIIVLRKKVLQYTIGNAAERAHVIAECKKVGVAEDQMDWTE